MYSNAIRQYCKKYSVFFRFSLNFVYSYHKLFLSIQSVKCELVNDEKITIVYIQMTMYDLFGACTLSLSQSV